MLYMVTGGEVSFQIRVRPSVADATDYYMLMDYSYSMRNDVAVIRTLTSSIGMYFRLLLSLSVFVLLLYIIKCICIVMVSANFDINQ